MATHKLVSAKLKLACHKHHQALVRVNPVNIIAAVWEKIERVAAKIDLEKMGIKSSLNITMYLNQFHMSIDY